MHVVEFRVHLLQNHSPPISAPHTTVAQQSGGCGNAGEESERKANTLCTMWKISCTREGLKVKTRTRVSPGPFYGWRLILYFCTLHNSTHLSASASRKSARHKYAIPDTEHVTVSRFSMTAFTPPPYRRYCCTFFAFAVAAAAAGGSVVYAMTRFRVRARARAPN